MEVAEIADRDLSPNFYTFMKPRNRVQGMNSASLCSLAGRYNNPIPSWFLAPIDCLKIPALAYIGEYLVWNIGGKTQRWQWINYPFVNYFYDEPAQNSLPRLFMHFLCSKRM
jgi:hypothetical protein